MPKNASVPTPSPSRVSTRGEKKEENFLVFILKLVLIVVVFPKGIVGMLELLAQRRKKASPPGSSLLAKPIESAE